MANEDDFSFSCKLNSCSQERLCTWPYFESEGFWNSEMAYSFKHAVHSTDRHSFGHQLH